METEKINKYQNGKIYTLRHPSTDKIYIGSTVKKYLCNRLAEHNSHYKCFLNGKSNNVTSFEIIKLGDSYIELLELFPCNSKLELNKREGELIREHKNNCVNSYVAGRTGKEYNIECADKRKETNKQHYENNKETIKEKRSTKYICDCGSEINISVKSRHEKSIKHQDYLKSIQ
jgi:hypothetical protein